MRERAKAGGGMERREKEKQKGKLSAPERIEQLLDQGSFEEVYTFARTLCTEFDLAEKRYLGDGLITGFGQIDGRQVAVLAHDVTVLGGSGTCTHLRKWCQLVDAATKMGVPIIQLNESGGGRVQEGLHYLSYSGSIFYSNTKASGVVPQVTAILGRNAGHGVYGAALTDFTFMVEDLGEMYITGPSVIKAVTSQDITSPELGGAKVHNKTTGVADLRVPTEQECFQHIRKLLSYLPSNWRENPPKWRCQDDPRRADQELNDILPASDRKMYDMKKIIQSIADDRVFFEIKPEFAKNIIVGFARFGGRSVGVVANQPYHLGGCLTVKSSIKSSRFVRFCDSFNIPLLFLVDTPGYLPGVDQEHAGIISHGAKLLYAVCESTVPKISVVIRKAYGGGNLAMGGHKEHGVDLVYSWPTGEFAIMGAEQAAALLYRKELKQVPDPQIFLEEKIQEYREQFANPYYHAESMNIDDVIAPTETRWKIIHGFNLLENKDEQETPRKHGNMPL
ncbi:MAG: acyl-CoA carboxylase subunit beta [Desulfobacteraceae bacterium]|nr:acyl-CoA carboxylase subunit beta [Desulfobacteraceae bacterium]